MKISELDFRPHETRLGTRAVHKFDNGYSASVLLGEYFYSNGVDTYEIAVLGKDGALDYTTSVTDDVLGYLSESQANEVLKQIEELPSLEAPHE